MSVSQLVRHFEGLGKIPVSIADVLHKVKELSLGVEVSIKAVDRDYKQLKAFLYRFQRDKETLMLMPVNCALVVYSSRMPLPWQRLACCKELLHVLDPVPVRTSSKEEVIILAEKMAKSYVPISPSKNGLQTFFDQIAKWQAVALLFPYGFYEEILSKFKAGECTCEEIAAAVQLPPEIVHVVLQDSWGLLRQSFLLFA